MDSDDDSKMFKVDHSDSYTVPATSAIRKEEESKKLDNFFNKDTEILKQEQKRKVVYGAMEQEERTVY